MKDNKVFHLLDKFIPKYSEISEQERKLVITSSWFSCGARVVTGKNKDNRVISELKAATRGLFHMVLS